MPASNSNNSFIWDALILCLIIFSAVVLPFQAVFLHDQGVFWYIYLIDAIFLVDVARKFKRPVFIAGELVSDRNQIRKYYLRKGFYIDLFANIPFDLFFLIIPGFKILSVPAFLIIRLTRTLRIFRLNEIFNLWEKGGWINAGYLRIVKFVVILILAIHFIASGWYLTAFHGGFPTDSWAFKEGIHLEGAGDQYVRSLYWAVTTMTTVGFGDITPGRTIEYIFTIVVMLMGASMYAFLIGNVAALVSNLDSTKLNFWNRFESVTQYLRHRKVPTDKIDRIKNYYDYMWDTQKGLSQEEYLSDLPEPLQLEVLQSITQDLLEAVPLFSFCSPILQKDLLKVLKTRTHAPGTLVVNAGSHAGEIVFISKGEMEIFNHEDLKVYDNLKEREYYGLLPMILNEKRTASIRTVGYCEVLVLNKEEFMSLKSSSPEFNDVLKKVSKVKSEKLAELILDGVLV